MIGVNELAQLKAKDLVRYAQSGAITEVSATTIRLELQIAERKVTLLMAIVELEIDAIQLDRKAAEI
ncbi:MAG: hypothetical protein ABGX22_03830 [Pirellulaceae bacterium]